MEALYRSYIVQHSDKGTPKVLISTRPEPRVYYTNVTWLTHFDMCSKQRTCQNKPLWSNSINVHLNIFYCCSSFPSTVNTDWWCRRETERGTRLIIHHTEPISHLCLWEIFHQAEEKVNSHTKWFNARWSVQIASDVYSCPKRCQFSLKLDSVLQMQSVNGDVYTEKCVCVLKCVSALSMHYRHSMQVSQLGTRGGGEILQAVEFWQKATPQASGAVSDRRHWGATESRMSQHILHRAVMWCDDEHLAGGITQALVLN